MMQDFEMLFMNEKNVRIVSEQYGEMFADCSRQFVCRNIYKLHNNHFIYRNICKLC